MTQLLLAVDLMHRQNIIHRDLKPENILILDKEDLSVCIADLGMAMKSTDRIQAKIKCGTPTYVDPDVIKGIPFTKKSDIFGLGSILFNLITSKLLFSGKNSNELLF